ncbi:hypothetical protein PNEG_01663 [Pneumocystis murina B123]|uniref:UDP-N-acetylglucosamine diphosphorylase n=1 Tax=Pneumocystis murina (strain B123) TaxID=1069680 RepID=M7NMK2_PNEMU|nr:hypothetical protein PNEG_01663 [Pneumocystis murina B123]EMR09903.1 hypothetical protein PNEG_01663 [Pneumocystis murina B123]
MELMEKEVEIFYKIYQKYGQEHVWEFYETFCKKEREEFLKQIKTICPDTFNKILFKTIQEEDQKVKGEIKPISLDMLGSTIDASQEELSRWMSIGLENIFHNRVAVILLAGGQATRLGTDGPKGCFDIGLPSHKSLFQLQAERIRRLMTLAQIKYNSSMPVSIPWYIMTSNSNRSATEEFFFKYNFFGLEKNIIFFNQEDIPCFSYTGKFLLETKSKIAVSPNGNGGIYKALLNSNILDDLMVRKIQHIHCFCVDNCLVRVADPIFIGFSIERDLDVSTKVVRKHKASEKVGLVVLKNGKPSIIEYNEIDTKISEALDESSNLLKFRLANIANHYFNIRFLFKISAYESKLPYHISKKKVPFYDIQSKKTIVPETSNAIKLEKFIFDVFSEVSLNKFGCLEVARFDEFSPLKNSLEIEEDNANTSRRDILSQGRRWVEQAHGILIGNPFYGIEISPLVSYAGENLEFMQGKCYQVLSIIENES